MIFFLFKQQHNGGGVELQPIACTRFDGAGNRDERIV